MRLDKNKEKEEGERGGCAELYSVMKEVGKGL